jgi:hypothetical protein
MGDYTILRLIDGSEILCVEKDSGYCQMLKIIVMQDGRATMIPFVDVANFDDIIKIDEKNIIFSYKPKSTQMTDQHKKLIELLKKASSQIIQQPKKIIMP